MIGNICLILGLSFLWYGVILPLHRKTVRVQARRYQSALRAKQTLAVRSFYPGLDKVGPKELRRSYDVERAYNQIGRFS